MRSMPPQPNNGFVALVAVILTSLGALAFSLSASAAALAYADMVMRREMRIQAVHNVRSCLEALTVMLAKDFFMSGYLQIKDFGCEAEVLNPNFPGSVMFRAVAELNGIRARGSREVQLSRDSLDVVITEIQ